jgi:arylsulfate sulfotransferase
MPGQSAQFSTAISSPVWLVNNVAGGSSSTGTITTSGLYTAPATAGATSVQVTAQNPASSAQSASAQVSFFQPSNFTPGTVSTTNNPLVAQYTFTAPLGASVEIQFGTTTNYGLNTWTQQAPTSGGAVSILVAGMRASTTYHMQALVHLPNGSIVRDTDQSFTTGSIAPDMLPNITVQQTLPPAAGVEMLDLFQDTPNNQLTAVVTDLEGNVIWYNLTGPAFPIKLLPNGHMLIVTAPIVQEIDLAGNVLFAVPLVQVQSSLASQGLSLPPLGAFHHDILKLPNGHFILLINVTRTDIPGIPSVTGDILVDWDPQNGPVWTWNTFDHLSVSHAPEGLPDWTHSNALVYSPDDGNLLLSMRNQNWILKINYANGAGDGSILWHLGPQGDFTLPAGVGPIEWNYGQHYPVFLGPNTSGIFPLMFFNNGTVRYVDAANDYCGGPGLPSCYSSVPIFELNEYTKTVQILFEHNLSPAYSLCCGSVGQLSNGDLEYDIALDVNNPNTSTIQEITQEQNPQLVWQMTIKGELAYRGFRIPSLYPGVEWTQSAIAAANASVKAPTTATAAPVR